VKSVPQVNNDEHGEQNSKQRETEAMLRSGLVSGCHHSSGESMPIKSPSANGIWDDLAGFNQPPFSFTFFLLKSDQRYTGERIVSLGVG